MIRSSLLLVWIAHGIPANRPINLLHGGDGSKGPGKGFSYREEDGSTLTDREAIERAVRRLLD